MAWDETIAIGDVRIYRLQSVNKYKGACVGVNKSIASTHDVRYDIPLITYY